MASERRAAAMAEWYRGVPLSTRWPMRIGLGILVVLLGGFGVWAGMAPLDGAVISSGTFVATGQNKLVQHFEGGIVKELLAREGDQVEANQVLARMDETEAVARLRRLELKRYRLLAMRAALEAEIADDDSFELPPALRELRDDPEIRAILSRQLTELRARRSNRAAEASVLGKEIASIEDSIRGYQAQLKSAERRMALLGEELKDKQQLYRQNLVRKSDLLTLQRTEASLAGDLGELTGRIADANERVARADQRIVQLRSSAVQLAAQELRQTETELDDVQEQIRAAQAIVDRVEVRAPARGVVVRLNYHTRGAVVAPGATILELLPIRDELIIEARVKPSDVTHVSVGQEALVRLSALNRRITPTVTGQVFYLSADALAEPVVPVHGEQPQAPGRASYVVRVALDDADVHRRLGEFRPTPGMPADVYIKTGERTFFEYIMRPVYDSFAHAFRER